MSVIDDIVNVQITRSTTSITRQGFGTMLVLVNEEDGVANKGFRVKTYGSFSDVADDWDETDFAYIAAQAYFGQTPSPDYMMVGIYDNGTTEADTSYADALDKVYDLDSSWYALIADTRDATEIENLADSVAAYERIYITSSSDSTILDSTDSTDIASVLSTASHDRTAVLYSTDEAEAPEAAWFGRMLPTDPGSATWAFKSLTTISADTLSSAQAEAVFGKNANTYETISGTNITRYGTVASGEYLDVIRGLDWLKARMAEQIFYRLVNISKIPFTSTGLAIIEADMKVVLDLAVDRGVITSDYTISIPDIDSISDTDKADRYLGDVEFVATLQGAIHKVTINGYVSV